MHDFGGFDPALYRIDYPAPGHPALAHKTLDTLAAAGWPAQADERRGLDHGAWVPLLHLYPQADVPVFQVSGCGRPWPRATGRACAGRWPMRRRPRAHPTPEHFWPLLVAAGAAADGQPWRVVEGGVAHGMLAMDAIVFGDPA